MPSFINVARNADLYHAQAEPLYEIDVTLAIAPGGFEQTEHILKDTVVDLALQRFQQARLVPRFPLRAPAGGTAGPPARPAEMGPSPAGWVRYAADAACSNTTSLS